VIFGENITGPLRIGVLFMYRTKKRTAKAKTTAPINPVKTPKKMLTSILLSPFLDWVGVEGDGGVTLLLS
jgi:hypothetical protein